MKSVFTLIFGITNLKEEALAIHKNKIASQNNELKYLQANKEALAR